MHILLIHQAFTTLDEAGGTRHAELSRLLASRGHHITVISSPVSYLTGNSTRGGQKWVHKESSEHGVDVYRTYTYPSIHRSFFHRSIGFISFMLSSFTAGLKIKNVDLVWGTSPPIFQAATAWLLSRLKGVPLLFEVRDLWPAFAIELGVLRNPFLIKASSWLEKFLYRNASRVVVNSPGFVEHVTSRGARQVTVVPNGADPQMFDPAGRGTKFRAANNLEGKFVILYAGAHGLANNLGTVLKAAECLGKKSAIQFVLLGDGKEKKALQDQARQMGLETVLFLPPVAKNEMKDALAAADACLATLQPVPMFKTTYPNKVFDYMAAGRPVILAIDGVIRQVIEDSGAGVWVPPGNAQALADAALGIAADPELSRAMGAAGRRAVEAHYSRACQAEKIAQLMEEMAVPQGR